MTRQKNRIHLILALLLGATLLPAITPAQATGPACPTVVCVFENGALRFGNGSLNSINEVGLFRQPFYKSADGNWYQLTFRDYPLDMAIGSGTSGGNWTTNTVVDLSDVSGGMARQVIDYSNFIVTSTSGSISKGYGKIVVTGEFNINSVVVQVKHTYELGQTDSFVKTTTAVKNIDSSASLINGHIWVGTRDDYVGTSDQPKKRRGNLTESSGFEVLTSATDSATALEITTDNEGALFYSTTAGTNMAYNRCCRFSSAYNQNPSTSASNSGADVIPGITTDFYDGSYAAVLRVGDLAPNAESQIVWFYAAGAIGDLANVARAVAAAGAPAVPGVTRNDTGVVLTWEAPS
jgi:hypothetical protein